MAQLRSHNQVSRITGAGYCETRPWAGQCVWPECEHNIDIIDAPLCKDHMIRVYVICQETYLWMMEPKTVDPHSGREVKPPASRRRPPALRGTIYFVRLGDLVKIGFTTNMARRMTVIPHEEILGAKSGTMEDERRCHAAFKHLRVKGEWFRAAPDLLAFIADVTSKAA